MHWIYLAREHVVVTVGSDLCIVFVAMLPEFQAYLFDFQLLKRRGELHLSAPFCKFTATDTDGINLFHYITTIYIETAYVSVLLLTSISCMVFQPVY